MKLSEILNQQEIAESYLTQIKSEVMNLLITLVANGQSEIETDKLVKQLNGKQEGFNVTANSIRDLLKEWVIRWNNAAGYDDKPIAKNISPICEKVENAIILFKSYWTIAKIAPLRAEIEPIIFIKFKTYGENSNNGDNLQIMKILTIDNVKEWSNVVTEIGPSIVLFISEKNKNWVHLHNVPKNNNKHMNSIKLNSYNNKFSLRSVNEGVSSKIFCNSVVSKYTIINIIPKMKNKSPNLLIINTLNEACSDFSLL